MKICIIPEYSKNEYKTPPDEGIEKYSFHIIRELQKITDLYEVKNTKLKLRSTTFQKFLFSRLLLGHKFSEPIQKISPDIIFYIPSRLRSLVFIKVWFLRHYSRRIGSKIVLICLQPFGDSILLKKIIMRFLSPDLIFVQCLKEKKRLENVGCKVNITPGGVDIGKFIPVSQNIKLELRKKYSIPAEKFIVLHVGSINKWRNITILEKMKKIPSIEIILIGSTTTYRDTKILKLLKNRGINIITNYLSEIQEIFQLSDCYIFPVKNEGASIGMPLSILEAMACNLPVLTTKFGGLTIFFKEDYYFKYFDDNDVMLTKIYEMKQNKCVERVNNRKKILSFSWNKIARQILSESIDDRNE